MPPILIIANLKSGGGKRDILQNIIQAHPEIEIRLHYLERKDDIRALIRKHVGEGITAAVAAGGDGTISCIVSALMAIDEPPKLGIMPLGTLNHFAKDLGIPLDPIEAFSVILKGNTTLVDIGKVNDRYFINNSALGLYPHLVRIREYFQKRGWRKFPAYIRAAFIVIRRYLAVTIEYKLQEKTEHKQGSLIFIGNNKYDMQGPVLGTRERLDQGSLFISIAHSMTALGTIRLLWRMLRRDIMREKDFDVIGLQEFTITSRKKKILVSYDGEIAHMIPPLSYSIVPKALRVIIPTAV